VSFSSTPVNQTVREGDKTTFHCTATGNPTPVITWQKDAKTVGSGETLTLTAKRNHSGHYLCSAENGLGVTINASADLDVQCKINYFPFPKMKQIDVGFDASVILSIIKFVIPLSKWLWICINYISAEL